MDTCDKKSSTTVTTNTYKKDMNSSHNRALHTNMSNTFSKYPFKMMDFAHNSTP